VGKQERKTAELEERMITALQQFKQGAQPQPYNQYGQGFQAADNSNVRNPAGEKAPNVKWCIVHDAWGVHDTQDCRLLKRMRAEQKEQREQREARGFQNKTSSGFQGRQKSLSADQPRSSPASRGRGRGNSWKFNQRRNQLKANYFQSMAELEAEIDPDEDDFAVDDDGDYNNVELPDLSEN